MTAHSFEGWQRDRIAALLRSEHPLSPADREWLAKLLEGKVKLPRGRRPGYSNSQYTELERALRIAAVYVNDSVAERVAAGEPRWGLKLRAIEAVSAECCPSGMEPVDFQGKLADWIAHSRRREKRASKYGI